MPFTKSNDYLDGRNPIPTCDEGGGVLAVRFTLNLGIADLALNTIGAIGILPPNHLPVGVLIDGSDMDSGAAALVFQTGILDAPGTGFSAATADGGSAWGSTVAANTAFQQQVLGQPIALVTATQTDRKIGLKVTAAPTVAVAGTVGLTLLYRSI